MRRLGALAALTLLAGCGGTAQHSKAPLHGGRPHSPAFIQGAEHPRGLEFPRFQATGILTGYDAVTVSNIPRDGSARVVGCYATGTYANCSQARADFPSAHIVTITPTASFVPATCLDTEPGDSTPDQVAGWIARDRAAGVKRPCDYANASEMVTVQADLRSVPRSEYLLWVAAWDGNAGIPSGFDAHQWFSNCCIDRDTFSSAFFAAAPKPKPRTVCWGKHSTPTSTACKGVRLKATHYWHEYEAFHAGLARTQKLLAPVQGRINALSQNKTPISVPGYKGAGRDYLAKKASTQSHWATVNYNLHKALIAKYSG